ncbi:glycoside hydrolase family 3 C-terminal domain-containing protein [Amycolatopsis sp. NBC_01488]
MNFGLSPMRGRADQQPVNVGAELPALFPFGYGLHYSRHW